MNAHQIVAVLLAQTPAPPAIAPTAEFGFVASVLHAGLGEQAIMGILTLFSVISWGIIVSKWRLVRRAAKASQAFLETFWSAKRLDAIYQRAETLTISPLAQMFRAGYGELSNLKRRGEAGEAPPDTQLGDMESIERAMRRAAANELTVLEAQIPFLATCGATAPFIGLFGTVIGIIGAFQEIGAAGNANLATVAPGIGGALVATAFGLFAAIPAVMAYNFFLARIRILDTEMHNFSADFLNIIKRHFF